MTALRVALLAACVAAAPAAPAVGQSQAGSPPFPLQVVDSAGDLLTIRRPPQRIASLTLMTDEILLDLVGSQRLAAVTPMADDPGISNVAGRVAPAVRRLSLDVERLLALGPDLVFVASWSDADSVRQLRDAGLTVYRVASPRSIAAVEATIAEIGQTVGESARAGALIRDMEQALASVRSRVQTVPVAGRLRVLDYDPSGTSFGAGSSWDDIVRLAGCLNGVAGLASDARGNVGLSQEKLIALDPDVVVLPGWKWDDPQGARRAYDQFARDPAFRGLRAVRTGCLLLADERHRLSTSQYVVRAVEDLARAAYPALFR